MEMTDIQGFETWRKFFRTSRCSIIDVIENAILVAEKDCPEDLVNHRDRLAMKLYSSSSSSQSCYDRNTFCFKPPFFQDDKCGEKEMLDEDEEEDDDADNDDHYMSNAMAVENQIFAEVMEMKEILYRAESDDEILQSLKRLLSIGISYGTLEKSKIGIIVNNLRKYKSSKVRDLAKSLIKKWKDLVDQWVEEKEAIGKKDISKETPDSIIDQEGGARLPLVDDGGVPMEIQVTMKPFDDLNYVQNCDKNEQENGKTESLNEDSSSQIETKHMRLRIPLKKYKLTGLQNCSKQSKAIEDIVLPVNTMVATTDSDNRNPKMMHNDPAHQAKLEMTRKRLSEGYLQHNDAKKQKTIQIVDLPPLPPKQRNNTAQRPTVQNNQSPLKKRNIVGQKNVNSTPKKKPRERRLAHPKPGKMGKKLKKLLNR